jgi:hypothetical protein
VIHLSVGSADQSRQQGHQLSPFLIRHMVIEVTDVSSDDL